MRIRRTITVFDAPDLAVESAFWAGLLGGEVDAEDDWHSVRVDGEWRLGFQLAPDFVPPEWPGEGPRQQMQLHLDLYVDDLDEGRERVLALGGRLIQPAEDPTAPDRFDVYADPAGHPFCLCVSGEDARA
ncbi:VOC family protein [Clavibacter lycopersici]|uniref:VOC family protein n=1 Tax=Clavibacter lycopersici TaxID=2301718 RepID=A0A399T0C5_9MICO|nr:VOC family protein [Clavibacter lycopersici]RIJ48085.1 VOC family protein [Clavibacter lycopersici]RIJ60233.1 VOC family protein [Clavibacter lycopersici]